MLEGVKVVEVAMYAFVPSAAAVLGDWGADVIKIEHPETGDPVRGLASYGVAPGDGGVSMLWECFNRGKRSVGININEEGGLKLLMELIDGADVFLTSFMQPACRRLGIDADKVLARNPRIIYGRGTGQGPVGPDADKGGFDGLSYWGRAGVSIAAMPPGYDYPVMLPGPAFGDVQSGANLAGGIAAALYQREKTGKGAVVDVSLLSSGLWAMQASIAGAYAIKSDNIVQLDRKRPPNPLGNMYRSRDGRFFFLGMLQADRYWPDFCRVLDHPELVNDPRFNSMAVRETNNEACVEILDEIFAGMTFAEIAERLNRQEGQWSTVESPGDTVKDEQSLVNRFIQMVTYENGADLPLVTAPARVGAAPELKPAPAHGEHTDEVLGALGHEMDELIDLKVAGVIS